ncbi:MAG TPA: hypothetical protein VI913_05465 [Candidatus Peribacteraceae bacterium]|nr:hypothetical protein [Candidatus Peribacteraceae bacterium]
MAATLLSKLRRMETEEKLLNLGVVLTMISLFFPWLSGRWIADEIRTDTALSFSSYVSFVGLSIFLLQGFVLLVSLVPLWSGKIILSIEHKHIVRLYCNAVSTILIVAALSVLLKVTFDFPSMQIRFGVYAALVGSFISTLYSFLLVQEEHRRHVRSLFHQEGMTSDQTSLPFEEQPTRLPAETPHSTVLR